MSMAMGDYEAQFGDPCIAVIVGKPRGWMSSSLPSMWMCNSSVAFFKRPVPSADGRLVFILQSRLVQS